MGFMGDTTLRELVYGKGAHADPVACIEDISAELAARTVAGSPHSIWQIVEHMNYWMEFDLGKVSGEDRAYPQRAIESWTTDPNPAAGSDAADEAWKATMRRFADLLTRLARLAESDEQELARGFITSARRKLPGNRRCMPCCGRSRRITVITLARLHCFVARPAPGLLNVAAIPGKSCR
jgi:hypothetical protein